MTSPGWAQAAQWSHGVSKTNCRRISSLPRVIRRLNASVAIMIHGTESRHHAPQKDMENSQRQGYTPAQMMVCSSLPAADNMNGGLPPLCLPSPPPFCHRGDLRRCSTSHGKFATLACPNLLFEKRVRLPRLSHWTRQGRSNMGRWGRGAGFRWKRCTEACSL